MRDHGIQDGISVMAIPRDADKLVLGFNPGPKPISYS